MAFELNPQQLTAVKRSMEWWNKQEKQTFQVSGPAGSGKTTIVYELIKSIGLEHEEVLFMAFVGKATMALSLKGNNAKTIHSTIYKNEEVPILNEDGDPVEMNGRVMTRPSFVKRENLPEKIKLLVIDEGGMIDKKIGEDILSFGLPVLVLGDLDQLPPVFGDSYFLKNPDVVLTQVMRQAEDNPIIYLSQLARKGKAIPFGDYGSSRVIAWDDIQDDYLTQSDIIICGKNETRQNINDYYRHTILKKRQGVPSIGDKVICRQNNWQKEINGGIHLINGMIGYIDDIHLQTFNKKSIEIDFRPEFLEDQAFTNIKMDYELLFKPTNSPDVNKRSYFNKFQFGYAITTHLSQGSQYPDVFYYKEPSGGHVYQRKLNYTAITRAEKVITIAQEKRKFF